MVVQIVFEMKSDLVTAATLNRIRRENNERVGKDIRQYVLPRKFTIGAYSKYPGIIRKRTPKYARFKRKKVGHSIPNVLSGRLRDSLKANGDGTRITRTANGGKLHIRVYWSGKGRMENGKIIKSGVRESQRQELEAMNDEDQTLVRDRLEQRFIDAVNDPANQRKRSIRKRR